MKRLILSLAVLFSMFFLAENAKAQSLECSDYPSTQTVTFTAPNGCTGEVSYCCKTMEGGYEVQSLIREVVFTNPANCDWQNYINSGEFWAFIREEITQNGCGQSLLVEPCQDGVKPTGVSISIVNAACLKIIYNPFSNKLTFNYDECRMDGGYCYNKWGVCWDAIEKINKYFVVSSQSVQGDCEEPEISIDQIFEDYIFQGLPYETDRCVSSSCPTLQ